MATTQAWRKRVTARQMPHRRFSPNIAVTDGSKRPSAHRYASVIFPIMTLVSKLLFTYVVIFRYGAANLPALNLSMRRKRVNELAGQAAEQ